jgi:uncharacterized protein YfdQ (DUF2303 family)
MSSNPFAAVDNEGINSLMEAGVAAAEPFFVDTYRDDADAVGIAAILTVPTGYTTKTVDLEELRAPYRSGPVRKAGLYTVRDVNSFLTYYLKHAGDEAETWVTPGEVTAVLNASATDHAHWEDHRLALQLRHSPEWERWVGKSGQLLGQDRFAEFLEEGAADVVQPDMATVLEVVQSLEATTRVDFESAYRTADGQRGFKYVETTTARAGQKGELEIPSCFVLALRVYEGQDPINVTARFRYRINGDELRLGIVIDRIPEILEAALAGTVTTITEGIDRGTVLVGPAPGMRRVR